MSALRRRRERKLVVARGSLDGLFAGEPSFAGAIRLDAGPHRSRHLIAILAAIGAHAAIALAVLAQHVAGDHPAKVAHREIAASIVHPKAPPPPPPPARPPPAHPEARAPRPMPHAAPPPPAQSGRAIAVEGPADLTSFDLVIGNGASYAGGRSSSSGTNRAAVHDEAVGNGPPNSIARAADLARPPSLLDRDWSCAWPDEAQDSDLRDARVTMRVRVSPSGAPELIEIIAAPSGGFADAARACAEGARYRVALDPTGAPVAASTALFNVHFLR